jgi:putative ABC transport system substrate-binding protein
VARFPPDATLSIHRQLVIATVARHRLPAIYSDPVMVKSGGLMYYGPDRLDIFRRAASYVDRILRGEKPGDLPVQQPIKFELVINVNTAKALGLDVPPTLLSLADEVID